MTSPLEERIRTVLQRNADSMHVPEVSPGDRLVRVAHPPHRPKWARVLLAAASICVVGGGVLAVQSRDNSRETRVVPGAPVHVHHFETPTVVMDAAVVEVTAAGRTWAPPDNVTVEGDPGTPNEYTTLELTWHDGDIEQRIHIYFESDGVDWWANEIRTYNGESDGDWFEPAAYGEFFRSPLGTPFSGDLELPNLRIEGMLLQAFVPPDLCDAPSAPLAVVADFPAVDEHAGSGFGATFQVVDTATCASLAVADFTFEFAAADPSIVTIDAEQIADYPPKKYRIELQLLAEGTTTITATARNQIGDVIGTAQMTVNVRPPLDGGDTVTREGTVIGYVVPGQGLLIDGQPVRELPPPTTG